MATIEFRHVSKVYGSGLRAIDDFSLFVDEGERVVLVGPSGCGKSTLLRMLAGLESVSRGEVLINGRVVNDQPPQQRNIAMVFQNYALYPHKTVRQNIEFPLRMLKITKTERDERIVRAAELLGLEKLINQKPKQLSGGQRQRVAMARAIVRDPDVFLMDEPLSNLDAKLRLRIRAEIARLQRNLGTTMIYVTHDQAEAMSLGHRVVAMRAGRIQQAAEPQILYRQPANVFVAGFIGNPGMNIFVSRLLHLEEDKCILQFADRRLVAARPPGIPVERLNQLVGTTLLVGIRPESFVVNGGPGQILDNIEIETIEPLGHEMLVYFSVPVSMIGGNGDASAKPVAGTMVARLQLRTGLAAGDVIDLGIKHGGVQLFTKEGDVL